jgi:hypothetical protein
MVLVLTVMAGGGLRSILVDEVVGVAQPSSPPTPPTYLPWTREKRAWRGKWRFQTRWREEGVERAWWSRREVTKSSRPFFACMRELAPSPWSQPLAGAEHFWLSGAREEGGPRETPDSRVSPGPGPRLLWRACEPQRWLGRAIQSTHFSSPGPGLPSCGLSITPLMSSCCFYLYLRSNGTFSHSGRS